MVTRVWGKADSFELVFSHSGAFWQACVPADLEDGQYVTELYCIDDSGNMGYWTGILYICNSENVRVRIVSDKFRLWLEADIEAKLQDDLHVWMEGERIQLVMTCLDYVGRG
jgi:hypothetical protein